MQPDQLVDGAGFASFAAVGCAWEGEAAGWAFAGALAAAAGFGAFAGLAGLAGLLGLAGAAAAVLTRAGVGVAEADFLSGVSLHFDDRATA